MTDKGKKQETSNDDRFENRLNIWLQNIAIILAGTWAIITFGYEKIFIPQTAPVNISVNLNLHKSGMNGRQHSYAVEMTIQAVNPSTRQVFIYPSIWRVDGITLSARKAGGRDFLKDMNNTLNSTERTYQADYEFSSSGPIAMGKIFDDDSLKPMERIERKLIFYVPAGKYDLLEAKCFIPTGTKEGLIAEWNVDAETGKILPTYYKVGKDGKRTKLEADNVKESYGSQYSISTSQLSL